LGNELTDSPSELTESKYLKFLKDVDWCELKNAVQKESNLLSAKTRIILHPIVNVGMQIDQNIASGNMQIELSQKDKTPEAEKLCTLSEDGSSLTNGEHSCSSDDSLNDAFISLYAIEALSHSLGMKIPLTSIQKKYQREGWESPDIKGTGTTPNLWSYKRIVVYLKKKNDKLTWPDVFPTEKIDPATGKKLK
jgi:hypothetical protein